MEKKLGVLFTIVARPLFINTSLSISSLLLTLAHTSKQHYFSPLSLSTIHIRASIYLFRGPFISCLQIHLLRYALPPSLVIFCVLPVLFLRETLMHYVAGILSTRLNN